MKTIIWIVAVMSAISGIMIGWCYHMQLTNILDKGIDLYDHIKYRNKEIGA